MYLNLDVIAAQLTVRALVQSGHRAILRHPRERIALGRRYGQFEHPTIVLGDLWITFKSDRASLGLLLLDSQSGNAGFKELGDFEYQNPEFPDNMIAKVKTRV